jgi:NADP-dependent 3-hydroxy acid dehydrogenase YdfG
VIETIANEEGRMDGLVAAAGIQQETPALEYSAKDSNTMFEVNVTGVFMTSQAVAKQMIRFGNGGSIAMIASMSGTIANRVCSFFLIRPTHLSRSFQYIQHVRLYEFRFPWRVIPGLPR